VTASSDNRRHDRRVPFPCDAHAFGDGERLYNSHLVDLSASGAFLETPSPAPIGTTVLLRFKAGGIDVKLEAEVVHVEPERGVGLRFVALSPAQREALNVVLGTHTE
jgi:hypothetical protein